MYSQAIHYDDILMRVLQSAKKAQLQQLKGYVVKLLCDCTRNCASLNTLWSSLKHSGLNDYVMYCILDCRITVSVSFAPSVCQPDHAMKLFHRYQTFLYRTRLL